MDSKDIVFHNFIKVWMFREQFLTAQEEKSLRNTSLFASVAYTEACFFLSKPPTRLQLLPKSLLKYKDINDVISAAATKTLSRHLWYLSEEMVPFAFFTMPVIMK
jgi:hypothetical protein